MVFDNKTIGTQSTNEFRKKKVLSPKKKSTISMLSKKQMHHQSEYDLQQNKDWVEISNTIEINKILF